jgi:hypothetical protein
MKTQEENMIAINTWCQEFLAANGLTFMKPDISLRAGAGYHGYRFYLDKDGIHAFYTGATRETFDLDRLIRDNCLIGRELIFHWQEVKAAICVNVEESRRQQEMMNQFAV